MATFSEALQNTETALKLADNDDVTRLHDFLFAEPGKPMLFVGSGKNIDIKDAATRMAVVNPENTGGFTTVDNNKNALIKKLNPDKVFLFPHPGAFEHGFISGEKKFYRDALFYKAFTGKKAGEQLSVDLVPSHCYQYELNHSDGPLTPLTSINHFLVLHGGFGTPVAYDIESVLAEIGLASAQVCDYRNFCHGRFIFASNHTRHQKRTHTLPESDAAVILLVSPNEKKIATNIRKTVEKANWQVLPNETPIITIETGFNDPLATIDLHIKANVFLADLAENHHGINPLSPPNYGGVRKEHPMGGLRW